jgi:hypothetical protein
VVDGISSTTAWCLWWRVSASRASPTRVRWKKIGKETSQTRKRNSKEQQRRLNKIRSKTNSVCRPLAPFIGVVSMDHIDLHATRAVHVSSHSMGRPKAKNCPRPDPSHGPRSASELAALIHRSIGRARPSGRPCRERACTHGPACMRAAAFFFLFLFFALSFNSLSRRTTKLAH